MAWPRDNRIPPFPFDCVEEECLYKIADVLDCAGDKDYKVFAQKLDAKCNFKLGFTVDFLNAIGSHRRSENGPSYKLLHKIGRLGVCLVTVHTVLQEMGLAVADELVRNLDNTRRRYEAQRCPRESSGVLTRCNCHDCTDYWSLSPDEPATIINQNNNSRSVHRNAPPTQRQNGVICNQQIPMGNPNMNNLSLSPYLSQRGESSRQTTHQTFNISAERQTSLDENDNRNFEAAANLVINYEFHPPSDLEDEEEEICASCEELRLLNPDETERKVSPQKKPRQICSLCSGPESSNNTRNPYSETLPIGATEGTGLHPDRKKRRNNLPDSSTGDSDIRRFSGSDLASSSSSVQEIPRSNSEESVSYRRALTCTCGLTSLQVGSPGKMKKIFVSFAQDSKDHLEEVFRLIDSVKQRGFTVRCDMYEEMLVKCLFDAEYERKKRNTNDWLLANFKEATFVIFCISPKYYHYTKPTEYREVGYRSRGGAGSVEEAMGSPVDVCPSEDHLHAKYIYNQAHIEHMELLCKNERFLPVLFKNSGANKLQHVPAIFKSTNVYVYPDGKELLSYLEWSK